METIVKSIHSYYTLHISRFPSLIWVNAGPDAVESIGAQPESDDSVHITDLFLLSKLLSPLNSLTTPS